MSNTFNDTNLETLSARYDKLALKRQPYIDRAEQISELTIPFLVPREGDNEGTSYRTPWQSIGSFGVNSLASKIVLTLFPPNDPYARLIANRFKLKAEEFSNEDLELLERSLAKIEKGIMNDFEKLVLRPKLDLSAKHLLIAGNVLIYAPLHSKGEEDQVSVFPLKSYVVRRDMAGNVLEIITRQSISKESLPDSVYAVINNSDTADTSGKDNENEYAVYTACRLSRDGNRKYWEVWQEVKDILVPESVGEYKFQHCPFKPLRMIPVDGQDYGRSYCEMYIGDLRNVEGLTASVHQFAAAASKVVGIVKPNSTIDIRELSETDNGGFVSGEPDDIVFLQVDKGADMKVAKEVLNDSLSRLQYAFLMMQSIQRDAERVTREEIRLMANELDKTLGGVYSLLAGELQMWLARMQLEMMRKRGDIPELPEGEIDPAISTGIGSIGRGDELEKLNIFLEMSAKIGGVGLLKLQPILMKVGNALSLDTEGVLKTPEELQEEQQQAMQQNMMQAATPEAVKIMGQQMQQGGGMPTA